MRLLLGGSPCTFWSIAQKNNRETEASGMGWELFKNYLIAKEKFKPDYFLYENNVSADEAIKSQIRKELNAWDGTFLMEDTGVRYVEINSAKVSAQNRERFYVHNCGEVWEPWHRRIYLKDILESGESLIYQAGHGYNEGGIKYDKSPTLTSNGSWQTNNFVIEKLKPIPLNLTMKGKAQCLKASYYKDGIRNLVGNDMEKRTCVALPVENVGEVESIQECLPRLAKKYGYLPEMFNAYNESEIITKSPTLTSGSMVTSSCATTRFENMGKDYPSVYRVVDGFIFIKGNVYPVKLPNGYYIIRKLTVTECRRLQTIPDWYKMPCSDTQNYKMLGNGWTIEVIKHILKHLGKKLLEPLTVLSMYDGMSCGQIALKELGANVIKYYATEIDKYAIFTTQTNFPNTIQLGDAFQVREDYFQID